METPIDVAVKAAERAAQVLLDYFGRIKEVEQKAKNDFVTEADKLSEMIIIKTIREHFPQHTIIAEESGGSAGSSPDWKWYIDPLDGTKNFIHGLPVFCISIGVEYRGEIVAGVVNAPLLEEVFVAEKGGGAYCNGQRLKVSDRSFSEALIATGFPFRGKEHLDRYLNCFKEVFLRVSGLRRCGSAAIDLAYTAKGVFDGFWEMALNPWDVAAGVILIREAGGVVSDFKGEEGFLESGNIVGASPNTYGELLKIVQKHLLD